MGGPKVTIKCDWYRGKASLAGGHSFKEDMVLLFNFKGNNTDIVHRRMIPIPKGNGLVL